MIDTFGCIPSYIDVARPISRQRQCCEGITRIISIIIASTLNVGDTDVANWRQLRRLSCVCNRWAAEIE